MQEAPAGFPAHDDIQKEMQGLMDALQGGFGLGGGRLPGFFALPQLPEVAGQDHSRQPSAPPQPPTQGQSDFL